MARTQASLLAQKVKSNIEQAAVQDHGQQWLEALLARFDTQSRSKVEIAYQQAMHRHGEDRHWCGESLLDHACGVAWIVADLGLDAEAVAAAFLIDLKPVAATKGAADQPGVNQGVASLAAGVRRLASIQVLGVRGSDLRKSSEKAAQLEAIRKLLLAMVEDIRVVLLKLADQLQTLRYVASQGDDATRRKAAQDTLDLLAPLANRLGVWQLKWELEDLAFRCLDPETYKAVASELDEKRPDRERYLEKVVAELRAVLQAAHIDAEISGRAKHIYSIWKKMQRKGVRFEQLSDVRAVRVLVEEVSDCYSVLGLVHQRWTPIPGEFDDYIAKPKSNDYRSLHTAVAGPEDKIIEIQIRTREMHEHAELGVAAHWRYKEASRGDAAYDRKVAWLRQLLDWRDDVADAAQLAETFRGELRDDTVYALTPQGRVIDLPAGSTPVDFAYHVHTELGHRCRGAKVDGRLVPLNQALANGQMVEIVAAKSGGPSRDWMNPALGYIVSNRARAKLRHWFNSQAREEACADGKAELEKGLQRLGHGWRNPDELADALGYSRTDDLYLAFHRGDVTERELRNAIEGDTTEVAEPIAAPRAKSQSASGAILVVGLDRLLTSLARCCKPIPPDPIVGFVSKGRGISVHRAGCRNLTNLEPERLIEAQWANRAGNQYFEADLEITADRQSAPIRTVLEVLAGEKVRVIGTNTQSGGRRLRIVVTVETQTLEDLDRPLALLANIDGVIAAHRV
ncbi:MAG: bifunctional (p)ppGpp synthetase/guanosine-3',5'-bis(diphosphate) 3'-pyrophosphohydrolase [Betaproteobacteria bacterium]|nr:MAG: bifunctional (p)ppGpp synthetase/guanosine-3',5'-bis(diphosphate) 3'-pyrophosphohydrolase [Betaproteobacteria bacterium]